MKIVNWNCNGALRKKLSAISALRADVYVIQECEDPARCSAPEYRAWATNYLWVGTNKNKGLGIFADANIPLEKIDLDLGSLELFLPCKVAKTFTLLAAWTRQANSPTFGYIGQLWKLLQQYPEFFREGEAALIGDLNSNARWDVWDRWWNHSDVVAQLQARGLESMYHRVRREAQGKESSPTFFMHRNLEKPYHIDYAFMTGELSQEASIEVGTPDKWLEFSDHMPLVVRIADNN